MRKAGRNKRGLPLVGDRRVEPLFGHGIEESRTMQRVPVATSRADMPRSRWTYSLRCRLALVLGVSCFSNREQRMKLLI